MEFTFKSVKIEPYVFSPVRKLIKLKQIQPKCAHITNSLDAALETETSNTQNETPNVQNYTFGKSHSKQKVE